MSFLVLAPNAPHFTVLSGTEAYLSAVAGRQVSVGRGLFEGSFEADEAAQELRDSLQRVLQTGRPDTLRCWGGHRWTVLHSPVLSPSGEVLYILHQLDGTTATEASLTAWCFGSQTDEMTRLVREKDWGATPLGLISQWPISLRCALSTCLSSPFPIAVLISPELRLVYNDAHRPNMGAKHPRVLGRPMREGFPEAWTSIGPLLETVNRTGEAASCADAHILLDRSGYLEESYWNLFYAPIRDQRTGSVLGVFGCLQETTARVIGERRLRTLRDLSVQASNGKTATAVCELAGAVLAKNPRDVPFALFYLLEQESVLRLRSTIGPTPDGCPPTAQLEGPAGHSIELLVRTAWQTSALAVDQPALTAALPLSLGVLVVGLNRGRALDHQYRTFLSLVASQLFSSLRTAREREREQLRAEELAALDRAKTTFFHNISHEFRTPLTLMLGPLEEVLLHCRDCRRNDALIDHQDRFELMHRNAGRLLKLVNSLLDFSRIEAGRMQARYRPVDLATVTAGLAGLFRSACEKAGLRLVVNCQPLREALFVDPEMWEKVRRITRFTSASPPSPQIVLNLLSNAFKFTLHGQIEMLLSETGDGQGAQLTVRDTGCGIPASEMPRLFERFHRIPSTRGRTTEGTGIGNALVYELVRLQGGTIRAESQEGQGTAFFVTLPFGRQHLPADCVLSDQAVQHEADLGSDAAKLVEDWSIGLVDDGREDAPIASNKARLLVADDNADMRKHLRRVLSPGYEVIEVVDGEAALDLLRSLPAEQLPELFISDVMMPRRDGLSLLQAIRADARLQQLPVLLLSARAGEEATAGGIVAGADDYLVKPFSAKELLARVAGRLELARFRLSAAKKEQALREEAERVNAAKDRFLATLSHELRTPLTPTLLLAESMAADETLPSSAREDAAFLARNVRLEADLINDLLDVAKIREGKLALHKQCTSVHQLLLHALQLVQETARQKQITVRQELEAQRDCVLGDPIRLQQVFWNLLGNAAKFTPEQGQIQVRSATDDRSIHVTVQDTGKGISPKVLPKLFTAFEQGGAGVTRAFGGLGLGLCISKTIVTMHGGTLAASSEGEGKGATFVVTLPLTTNDGSPAQARRASPSPPDFQAQVLVVEDNAATVAILQRLLARLGHTSQAARTVGEALALLRSPSRPLFDILLCDIGLPDDSGLTVIREMRAARPGCRCIALSGYGTPDDVQQSLAAGADLHLTKPVRLTELADAISQLPPSKA